MIRKGICLGVCFMFLGVGVQAVNVFAAEVPQSEVSAVSAVTSEVSATTTDTKKNVWNVGLSISNITYEEPGLMEEAGMFVGIDGSYAYHNKLMLKVEGKVAWGLVNYDGAISDGMGGSTPYAIDDVPDYMWEVRGLGGYDIPVSEAVTLTPYIGIGYRYLNDNASLVDPAGYEREANYTYSPIGIEFSSNSRNGWSVGATLEYDIFWGGLQISDLSDFGYGVIENDQTDGYGYRASVKFQNKHVLIEPYLKYWAIEDSEIVDGFMEPKNNSTEVGIMFAGKF